MMLLQRCQIITGMAGEVAARRDQSAVCLKTANLASKSLQPESLGPSASFFKKNLLRSVTITKIGSLRLLDRQESPETSQVGSKRRPNGRQGHHIGFQDQLK